MKKYKDKKQYRRKGYDYSQDGFYFVTICVKNREMFFGDVVESKIILSKIGLIADDFFRDIPNRFSVVKIDEYIIMPNHIHGIIVINNCRNAPGRVPTGIQPLVKNSLSSVINHFKGNVKKICNKNKIGFEWQSRFHDRIIRNSDELNRIRQYIINNPVKWDSDRNNLENLWI